MSVNVGTAEGHLDLDISGFLNGLKTAQSEATKSFDVIESKAGKSLEGLGSKMSGLGDKLTLGITAPLAGVAAAGLKVATDFEKSMSNVQAISGATGDQFNALREEAIQLGADTAFSSTEVADAMTEMAKAGWDTNQILDGMSGVLDAAAASGENLGTVSTIVADAITGFGLSASDSTRVADLLTQSANAGTIGINDLGESFKYIAPIANTMGFSIEDVTTAITALSTAGIKGSQAGTSLRGVLTRMVKPTDDVAAAMDELGISLANQDGTFKSLNQIMSEMRGSFAGMTDEQKAYYAAILAGTEGQSGLLTLLNMTQEEYDAISESMYNAGGVAQETAEIMQDNLQSKLEQLGGSLESLAIKVADLVIPALTGFVEKVTDVVNWFINLDSETQKTILQFATFVAAIGPALSIFGRLTIGVGGFLKTIAGIPNSISGAKTAITNFVNGVKNIPEAFILAKAGLTGFASQTSVIGTALAGITAPIAAIIAAVVSLGAAFATLWNTNEDFRNSMINTWNELVNAWNEFCQGIVDRINELGFDFKSITDMISQIWNGFCELLAPVFQAAWDTITGILEGVMDTITGILDVIIGIFTGDAEQITTGLTEIVNGICQAIQSLIEGVISAIGGFIDTALGFIGTNLQTVVQNIITFFQQLPTNIANFLSQVISNIQTWAGQMVQNAQQAGSNFLNGVISFISQLPYNIGYLLGTVIGTVASWVIQFVQNAIQAGQQFLHNVVNFISQLPSNVASLLANVISNVANWVSQMVTNAINAGSQFVANVVNFISQLPGNIATFLSTVISNVAAWASNMINAAVNMASNFVSSVINGLASLPGQVVSIGSQVVQGIWNGISGAAGWLYDQVAGFVGGIVDGAKAALGIKSPSRVMANEVGKYIPSGVAQGIDKNKYVVNTAMSGMINGAIDTGKDSASGAGEIGELLGDELKDSLEKQKDKVKKPIISLVTDNMKLMKSMTLARVEATGKAIDDAMTKQINELNEKIAGLQEDENKHQAEVDAKNHQKKMDDLQKQYDELEEEEQKKYAKLKANSKTYYQDRQEIADTYAKKRQDLLNKMASEEEKWENKRTEEAKQAEIKLWQERLAAMEQYKKEYEDALQEILDKQTELSDKMKDFGDLFETITDDDGNKLFNLTDLQEQIDAIEQYGDSLESLKERGISQSLMDEILSMNIEDANQYTQALLEMSDAQYKQYMALWDKKQQMAEEIAKKFYANEMLTMQTEFLNKIPEEFSELRDEIKQQGLEAIKGFIQGMLSGSDEMSAAMKEIIAKAMLAFGSSINNLPESMAGIINSGEQLGSDTGEAVVDGIKEGAQTKLDEVAEMLSKMMEDGLLNMEGSKELGKDEGLKLISDDAMEEMLTELLDVVDKVKEEGNTFIETITKTIEDWVEQLFEMIDEYLYTLQEKWYNFLEIIYEICYDWYNSKFYPYWATWFIQFQQLNQQNLAIMQQLWIAGLQALYGAMIPIGQGIADGVLAGFNEAWPRVVSAVMSAVQSLAAAARAALQIGSPSKVFKNEIGRWLPPGISEGFKEAMPRAIKDIQNSIDDGVSKLDTSKFSFNNEGVLNSIDSFNSKLETMKRLAYDINDSGLRDTFSNDFVSGNNGTIKDTIKVDDDSKKKDKSGGDTFIFNSPKAIDEVEAAKQMRRTKRNMASGFEL